MSGLQGVIDKLGSNFLVAAFIPSLAFMTLVTVTLGPIVPVNIVVRIQDTFNPLGQPGILLLLFTVVLGFTLSSLNTFIYKIFEGYFLLERLPFLRTWQRRKAAVLKQKLHRIQVLLYLLEKWQPDSPLIEALKSQQYYIEWTYQSKFPPSEQGILPTRFGNVLRAAENYSALRYGIDAVPMWPRFVHVIPDTYYEKIDQSNNQLAFLVNCAFLCLLFSIVCICAGAYQYFASYHAGLQAPPPLYFIQFSLGKEIYQQRAILYLIGSGVAFFGFWGFYRASLAMVEQYGDMIRSAFDLFRFSLLQLLHQELPKDLEEEQSIWRKISEFVVIGEANGQLEFRYNHATANTVDKAADSSGGAK